MLSDEFLTLAPHEMSYDDLEVSRTSNHTPSWEIRAYLLDFKSAQRDILSAFSFSMGSVTPGAYMQELWLVLPSLRGLLAVEGEWEAAQRATWELLSNMLLGKSHSHTHLFLFCTYQGLPF